MNKPIGSSRTFVLFLLSIVLGIWTANAQSQPSPKMVAANQLFNAKKYSEAIKAYTEITKEEPNNTRAWSQLGMSHYSLQQYRLAIESFQKEIAISPNPTTMYNIACNYALDKQKDKALEWLGKAVENNLPTFVNPAADTDFESLRDEPRFKEIMITIDKRLHPCMYSPEARQFDFWVGEWSVVTLQGQQGRPAGTSVIQQIAEGCGILENWQSGGAGLTGKSLNFYDQNAGKWYQYWVGPGGGATRYSGVYKDGAMRFETEPFQNLNGQTMRLRLTFFNIDANTVRQFAESTTDDGKTWTVNYDFKYVRKK
ncbi:MAG TPA: tetratricopeptide repeat protein [Bacteroidota bacterium]